MRNCPSGIIPTLQQLREHRRTGSGPKVDVMKSAGTIIPVFNPHTGELLGFGRAERVGVSKSIGDSNGLGGGLGNDLNSVFDDSPLMPQLYSLDMTEVIEKSAQLEDDPTAELMEIFPLWLQNS